VSIQIEEKSLLFDKPGQTQSLLVWATYGDGTKVNVTESSLTTYAAQQSNSAPVISVSNCAGAPAEFHKPGARNNADW